MARSVGLRIDESDVPPVPDRSVDTATLPGVAAGALVATVLSLVLFVPEEFVGSLGVYVFASPLVGALVASRTAR